MYYFFDRYIETAYAELAFTEDQKVVDRLGSIPTLKNKVAGKCAELRYTHRRAKTANVDFELSKNRLHCLTRRERTPGERHMRDYDPYLWGLVSNQATAVEAIAFDEMVVAYHKGYDTTSPDLLAEIVKAAAEVFRLGIYNSPNQDEGRR